MVGSVMLIPDLPPPLLFTLKRRRRRRGKGEKKEVAVSAPICGWLSGTLKGFTNSQQPLMKPLAMAGATLRRENNKSLLFLQPTHTVTTKNILFCQSEEQPSHSGTDWIFSTVLRSHFFFFFFFFFFEGKLKKHSTWSQEFHLLVEAHLYSRTARCAGRKL